LVERFNGRLRDAPPVVRLIGPAGGLLRAPDARFFTAVARE
jgi:hypothetical protein